MVNVGLTSPYMVHGSYEFWMTWGCVNAQNCHFGVNLSDTVWNT